MLLVIVRRDWQVGFPEINKVHLHRARAIYVFIVNFRALGIHCVLCIKSYFHGFVND